MNRAPLFVLAASFLAGCSWSQKIEGRIAPDTVSLADRCGAIMQAAMPFAQLDLGDRTSHSPDVSTIIAQVAATRTDLPKDVTTGRDLMAECTFRDNVMVAFRWTKGGPPPPPGSDETAPPAPGNAAPASSGPAPAPANTPPGPSSARPFH